MRAAIGKGLVIDDKCGPQLATTIAANSASANGADRFGDGVGRDQDDAADHGPIPVPTRRPPDVLVHPEGPAARQPCRRVPARRPSNRPRRDHRLRCHQRMGFGPGLGWAVRLAAANRSASTTRPAPERRSTERPPGYTRRQPFPGCRCSPSPGTTPDAGNPNAYGYGWFSIAARIAEHGRTRRLHPSVRALDRPAQRDDQRVAGDPGTQLTSRSPVPTTTPPAPASGTGAQPGRPRAHQSHPRCRISSQLPHPHRNDHERPVDGRSGLSAAKPGIWVKFWMVGAHSESLV